MRRQTLGRGLEVSAVGLGCMGMSHANGAPIAGTRKSSRLRENACAGDLILTADEMAAIDAIATVPER